MEKEVVMTGWQIATWVTGILGFTITLTLFVMKLRETAPTLMVLPPGRDFRYLAVRLHNKSKFPITITRIRSFPKFLREHATVEIGTRSYDGTGIDPCHPFWLLPDEQVTIKYWYEWEKGKFPPYIWIIYPWHTQGSWRLPRVPLMVWRRRKDLEFQHNARYLKNPD